MTALDEWLAAMPVSQLDEQIDAMERKLAFLRMVREMRPTHGSAKADAENGDGHSAPTTANRNGNGSHEEVVVRRPLTDERAEIVRVMLQHPQRAGSPTSVAAALKRDMRPTGTTMMRMANAKQLERVRKGLYRVPEEIAAQVANMPPPARIEGLG